VQLLEKVQEEEGIFSIPMIRMSRLAVIDPELHPVVGIGKVVNCTVLPENRYNIVVLGVGRMKIEQELERVDLYRTARGCLLKEETDNFDVVPLKQLLTQIIMRNPSFSDTLNLLLDDSLDPRTFLNTVAQLILSDADERQNFLELQSVYAQGDFLSEKLAGVLLDGIGINE
jgi:Lon protease-like protein